MNLKQLIDNYMNAKDAFYASRRKLAEAKDAVLAALAEDEKAGEVAAINAEVFEAGKVELSPKKRSAKGKKARKLLAVLGQDPTRVYHAKTAARIAGCDPWYLGILARSGHVDRVGRGLYRAKAQISTNGANGTSH